MKRLVRTRAIAFGALLAVQFVCTAVCAGAEDLSGQGRAETAGRALLGSAAPNFVLKTIDGEVINLGKLYGKKAVYLKFWETWCQPCREQMPHFQRTHEAAGDDLVVIAVDTGINDPLADIQKYRRKAGMTMPIVIDDGRLGSAFNLRVTPQHVVIGRDGRIQYMGHLADERLETALRTARAAPISSQKIDRTTAKTIVPVRVGDALPALSAKMVDGGVFHAQDRAANKPTVLVFLSPWCESYLAQQDRPQAVIRCRQVREQVNRLAMVEKHVRWLGVSTNLWTTEGGVRRYGQENNLAIPLMFDDSGIWFRSFGVLDVPTLWIADAHNKLIRRIDGFEPGFPGWLQENFGTVRAERN